MLAVTAGNVGLMLLAIVLLGILAFMGIGALTSGVQIIRVGGGLAMVIGSVLALFGAGILIFAGTGFANIGSVLHRGENYQSYKQAIVVVRSDDQTLADICSRQRPTWKIDDCVDRIHEQNRAVDVDHLRVGDRIFVDKKIGGQDRDNGVEYQQTTTTIGRSGEFRTLYKVCAVLRPTWKPKPCVRKITDENPAPAPGISVWVVTVPSYL